MGLGTAHNSIHRVGLGSNPANRIQAETALDWYRRSSSRSSLGGRRKRDWSCVRSNDKSGFSNKGNLNTASDPFTAAWRFLRYGTSGIAPVDAIWKQHNENCRFQSKRKTKRKSPLLVLEGSKGVGKTWILLTLAARYVVATRRSCFRESHSNPKDANGDEETEDAEMNATKSTTLSANGPMVLLLDSTYDFSSSQLVNIIRFTLKREYERQQQHERRQRESKQQNEAPYVPNRVDGRPSTVRDTMENDGRQREQRQKSLQKDLEDCMSRIHVVQVDGATGWVPMLEVLRQRLSKYKMNWERDLKKDSSNGESSIHQEAPPALLLWDGFLSDVPATNGSTISILKGNSIGGNGLNKDVHALFDSPAAREILTQFSRLLHSEGGRLWCVLTARTPAENKPVDGKDTAPNTFLDRSDSTGIGYRVEEWMRKEEERQESQETLLEQKKTGPPSRMERRSIGRNPTQTPYRSRVCYRMRLGRRHAGGKEYLPTNAAEAAALVAKIVTPIGTDDIHSRNLIGKTNLETFPYSISLGGILS